MAPLAAQSLLVLSAEWLHAGAVKADEVVRALAGVALEAAAMTDVMAVPDGVAVLVGASVFHPPIQPVPLAPHPTPVLALVNPPRETSAEGRTEHGAEVLVRADSIVKGQAGAGVAASVDLPRIVQWVGGNISSAEDILQCL